jgi:hypothetical protein
MSPLNVYEDVDQFLAADLVAPARHHTCRDARSMSCGSAGAIAGATPLPGLARDDDDLFSFANLNYATCGGIITSN